MKCTCPSPGQCPRYGRQMPERLHYLCQTRDDYRKLFGEKYGVREGGEFIPAEPQPEEPTTPDRLTCLHRSAAPIDYAGCGCTRKHVFACEHADRGGKCTWQDMQGCELWEDD